MYAIGFQGVWFDLGVLVGSPPPSPSPGAVTGAGGSAPRQYWGPQKTNMRNAFMIEDLKKRAQELDKIERAKLAALMYIVTEENEYE